MQIAHANRGWSLDDLGRHAEAASDWRKALRLDNGQLRLLLTRRLCLSLARSGNHAEATKLAAALARGARTGPTLYDLSCVFAISSAHAARRKTAERPEACDAASATAGANG